MAQPREAAAAGQGGMLGSGALEQPGPDIEHTHTLRGTRARGAEAAADIGGADKAHLSDNDFVSGYFCAAGNKWLQSAPCQLGREQQLCMVGDGNTAQLPTTLPGFVFSLAELVMGWPRQHQVTSQGDR